MTGLAPLGSLVARAISTIVGGVLAASAVVAPAAATQLAAHRAVYDFVLARSASAGSVADMTGRMVYELTGSSCDGYTQSMRFVTRATSQDGSASVNDMRSTSWEEAAGKSLKFSFNQYRDEKLADQTSGDAERRADTIRVELERPARKKIQIGPDTLFPIQHSIRLLEAARREDTVFEADLYDGSDKGEKVYSTTAMIGRAKPIGHNAALPKIENATRLDGLKSWPVALSYFEPGAKAADAVPTYELAFLFFENGVVRQLTLDYGDFALKGDLKTITFLEESKCDRKPK